MMRRGGYANLCRSKGTGVLFFVCRENGPDPRWVSEGKSVRETPGRTSFAMLSGLIIGNEYRAYELRVAS